MRKFRNKPMTIEAEQWFPDKEVEGVQYTLSMDNARHFVTTAHDQVVYLDPGDWIIKEPDGRGYYPCKPDIFDARYEAAE